MKVIIYHLNRLTDPADVHAYTLKWCKRRHMSVAQSVREYSERGRKLHRLIASAEPGTVLVVHSVFNLGNAATLIQLLPRLQRAEMTLALVQENRIIRAESTHLRSMMMLCELVQGIARSQRQESKKRGLLIAKWLGKQVGRKALAPELRDEAMALLERGMSSRQVVKAMNGRVGKTTVCKLARELRQDIPTR